MVYDIVLPCFTHIKPIKIIKFSKLLSLDPPTSTAQRLHGFRCRIFTSYKGQKPLTYIFGHESGVGDIGDESDVEMEMTIMGPGCYHGNLCWYTNNGIIYIYIYIYILYIYG